MTTPNEEVPSGSLQPGGFAAWQAETNESAKAKMKVPLGSWNNAQSSMKSEFISAPLFGGEVARLDNRIDELVIGTERAIRYTYTESAPWSKHPAGYRAVVDIIGAATCGVGSAGGFSGGWERWTFEGADYANLTSTVAVSIGSGTEGGSTAQAGTSSFGSYASVAGATTTNYGPGSRTYKMRGGTGGGSGSGDSGTAGSAGPFAPGGSGGVFVSFVNGQSGGNGFSVDAGQVGPGSAGGGGAGAGTFWRGGHGGHGGHPGGPGGGRGVGGTEGAVSGNGAGGMVMVTVYVEDTFGQPPSTPAGLVASSITKNSAHVEWDASIDDVMVKHYILYLDGARYGVVNALYHDFVGLTASTAYSVRVQAVDIGDNVSELSAVLNFTTTA